MSKESVEIIKKIESEFDVNSLTYRGVKVWPLIRYLIVSDIFHQNTSIQTPQPFTLKRASEILNANSGKLLEDVKKEGLYHFSKSYIKKSDICLISIANYANEKINGKYFHKFMDAIIEDLPQSVSASTLDWSAGGTDFHPRYHQPTSIDYLLSLSAVENSLDILKKNILGMEEEKISNITTFLEYISNIGIIFRYSGQFLNRYFAQIFILKEYFIEIFKAMDAKLIILQQYYAQINTSAILACKELSIYTADLQHGAIGAYDEVYFHWENSIQKEGYEAMPDYFLTWDETTKKRIEKWSSKTVKHKAYRVGNPWLAYYKNHTLLPKKLNFIDINKKVVLFTIQPMDDFLPKWVEEAMIESKDKTEWLIRLHPTHPAMLKYRESIIGRLTTLKANGVDTKWEQVTESSLYDLLKNVNLHITSHSTVAFEALEFGVPSILFGEFCFEYMGEEIENAVFYHAGNKKELIDMLCGTNKSIKKSRSYDLSNIMSFLVDFTTKPTYKIV